MKNDYPENTSSDASNNKKTLDIENNNDYYTDKMNTLKTLKESGLSLAKMYNANIKIEINVNKELELAKVSILEFNL